MRFGRLPGRRGREDEFVRELCEPSCRPVSLLVIINFGASAKTRRFRFASELKEQIPLKLSSKAILVSDRRSLIFLAFSRSLTHDAGANGREMIFLYIDIYIYIYFFYVGKDDGELIVSVGAVRGRFSANLHEIRKEFPALVILYPKCSACRQINSD